MKLTTLNLQGFDDWTDRHPAIIKFLTDDQADVIFFQEAVYLPEVSPFNPAQLLNQTLHYPFEHSDITRLQVGLHYPVYREGLVMLSKYPIVKSDTLILKQAKGDEHNRIVQLIDIEKDGEIIKLANIHFSITDYVDYATPHLQEVLELLRMRGEARIMLGDFNLSDLDASKHLWDSEYIASTEIPYVTFPKMNKRVDYALVPKKYSFESITVSDDSLSDHRALTVVIK